MVTKLFRYEILYLQARRGRQAESFRDGESLFARVFEVAVENIKLQ